MFFSALWKGAFPEWSTVAAKQMSSETNKWYCIADGALPGRVQEHYKGECKTNFHCNATFKFGIEWTQINNSNINGNNDYIFS